MQILIKCDSEIFDLLTIRQVWVRQNETDVPKKNFEVFKVKQEKIQKRTARLGERARKQPRELRNEGVPVIENDVCNMNAGRIYQRQRASLSGLISCEI